MQKTCKESASTQKARVFQKTFYNNFSFIKKRENKSFEREPLFCDAYNKKLGCFESSAPCAGGQSCKSLCFGAIRQTHHCAGVFARLFFINILCAVFLLTACSKKVLAHEEVAAFSIAGTEADFQKVYIKRIIERYTSQTGRVIEKLLIDSDGYEAKLKKSLQNGRADIFIHIKNSALEKLFFEGLAALIDDACLASHLTPGSRVFSENNEGKLLGLPFWERGTVGCYYNKSMFEKFGLQKAKSQEDFDTLCATLFNIGVTPFAWSEDSQWAGFCAALDSVFFDEPVLVQRVNSGAQDFCDIEGVCAAAAWTEKAFDNGWLGQTFQNSDTQAAFKRLASGECAMIVASEEEVFQYLGHSAFEKYDSGDFSLMPIFFGTNKNGTYQESAPKLLAVSSHSKNRALVKDFLEFCADKENYDEAFNGVASDRIFTAQATLVRPAILSESSDSIFHNLRRSTVEQYIEGLSKEAVTKATKELFTRRAESVEVLKIIDKARKKAK